jgi:hypothetical protein
MNYDENRIKSLKARYPAGTRIQLDSMNDPQAVEAGALGTVIMVDDIGDLIMKWDNGRSLNLIPGADSFHTVKDEPVLTSLKLYMPLTAELYGYSEYGDLEDESQELNGNAVSEYEDSIFAAIVKERLPEERERGIMHWYHEKDSVNAKVQSAEFSVENVDGRLWGTVECRVKGELTAGELDVLKNYVEGQASDGWGEGFEQREIKTDAGELYVHLWNDSDSWRIRTADELATPTLADGLPELCFSVLPSSGELICIKRGERGYYPSDWSTESREKNQELADYNNERLGVTDAQRQAMECGSMHGWEVPGADPAAYEQDAPQMGGMTLG